MENFSPRDKNAGAEGSYRITSLYFDTPSDTALRQKLEGVDRREKFRLRYYGEDLSFIRLEKKFKMNGLCGKHSARVTREQVRNILEGAHGGSAGWRGAPADRVLYQTAGAASYPQNHRFL